MPDAVCQLSAVNVLSTRENATPMQSSKCAANPQKDTMGAAAHELPQQHAALTPVRICGFEAASSDVSPSHSQCSTSFSEGYSPSRLKVPASPLSAALRENARMASIVQRPGLPSLKIGKTRTFAAPTLRKSTSCQQLQSLAEEQEGQSLGLRSGSCTFRRSDSSSHSPAASTPRPIPTPRAPSSGRAASTASSFVDEDHHAYNPHAGLPPVSQLQQHQWRPASPQGQRQATVQPCSQPLQPPIADGAPTAAADVPQRVPSPCGVLPDEPGAVFMLEPASLPRLSSGRMCDARPRSRSAAVLSAYG